MTDIENLIDFLEKNLKNDTSNNARELLISNEYQINEGILDSFDIKYRIEGSSTKIRLNNSKIEIFKSLNDALKNINSINKSIKYIILHENISQKNMLRNIQYFLKIKEILLSSGIIDFDHEIKKDFFLLSNTYGKINISYLPNSERRNYYSASHDLDFETLEKLMDTENFPNFFKDSIARFLSDKPKRDLYAILTNFDFLISNAKNALSLYQHNFSFEKFEKEFDENLSSNIKKLQELTASFQSKIMAIPIQFGVYIYLLSKFNDSFISILLVVVTVIAWSIFNYLITAKTYRNVHYLESKIEGEIALIRKKSGIKERKISKSRKVLTKDIYDMKDIISVYQFFSIGFTILILIIFALN